jgi:large subunit ribosomal protein L25
MFKQFTTMRTVDMIGYKRENLGKRVANELRRNGSVPCVLYGGEKTIHFHSPMILFRDVVYTPELCFVNMDIEGDEYKCVLQDVQFHPVSEVILHADFLLLNDNKSLVMEVPIKVEGNSPGVQRGGKLITKLRKIKVKALPKNMPENIQVDITGLELGKSIKIGALKSENFAILNNPLVTVASVQIPRALKGEDLTGDATAPAADAKGAAPAAKK